jgi:hypothetical protein
MLLIPSKMNIAPIASPLFPPPTAADTSAPTFGPLICTLSPAHFQSQAHYLVLLARHQQITGKFKSGHCDFQTRPLGVETGQYPTTYAILLVNLASGTLR